MDLEIFSMLVKRLGLKWVIVYFLCYENVVNVENGKKNSVHYFLKSVHCRVIN
jgi:hypothetical protein